MHIALIHLGRRLPRWLLPNAALIQEQFECDVTVVVDYQINYRFLTENKIRAWYWDATNSSPQDHLFDEALFYFRDGFWKETTRRFWALHNFQKVVKVPLLHVESDVLLMPSFPFHKFSRLKTPLAVPLSAPNYGVASIFYTASHEALRELLALWDQKDFELEASSRGHFSNDMTRLGASVQRFPDLISSLPTLLPCALPSDTYDSSNRTLSRNFEVFEGIFDAATYGQYLFGFDPRNERGVRRVYSWREYHTARPRTMRFRQSASGDLFVTDSAHSTGIPIFNLHIHSKDIRVFRPVTRDNLFATRLQHQGANELREFSWWGFIASLRNSQARLTKEAKGFFRFAS